jgi:predicted cobalt transporter CbtA
VVAILIVLALMIAGGMLIVIRRNVFLVLLGVVLFVAPLTYVLTNPFGD